jgi:hypothetical protein
MTVPIICLWYWHLVILWAIGLLWVTRAVRRNAITICWRRLRRFNLFYTRKSWQQLIKRMIAKAIHLVDLPFCLQKRASFHPLQVMK